MIKRIIFISMFIAIILAISTGAYCFDKEPGSIDIGDQPEFSYVKITTIGSALGLIPTRPYGPNNWKKSNGSFLLQGSGFVIKGGYIITAAHVVHPRLMVSNIDKYGRYIGRIMKVLSKSIIITPDSEIDRIAYGIHAKIYYLDTEYDIAILKFEQNNVYDPIPYGLAETKCQHRRTVGYYSLIQPGDSVALIAKCRDKDGNWLDDFEVRFGKVTSKGVEGMPENKIPALNMNDFTTDLAVYPGDSGSIVLAFYLGKPVVVGVARANNDQLSPIGRMRLEERSRSYVTRIDFIKIILESR